MDPELPSDQSTSPTNEIQAAMAIIRGYLNKLQIENIDEVLSQLDEVQEQYRIRLSQLLNQSSIIDILESRLMSDTDLRDKLGSLKYGHSQFKEYPLKLNQFIARYREELILIKIMLSAIKLERFSQLEEILAKIKIQIIYREVTVEQFLKFVIDNDSTLSEKTSAPIIMKVINDVFTTTQFEELSLVIKKLYYNT